MAHPRLLTTSTVATPALHVLPWNRPLPAQAAGWLARGWTGVGPLDLSHLLVIVPTRQSGRRLREALAGHASACGQAVFPPRVLPPEGLLAEALHATDVAPAFQSLVAWVEVLRGIDPDEFTDLFPVPPPARSLLWAARLGRQFTALQSELAENALRIGDVGVRAGEFPDSARWAQLAELEKRHDALLARLGLRDPNAARLSWALRPNLPPGVTRVVVLATPDPQPLVLSALAALSESVTVDVVVHAPADESAPALFDEWGRPRPEIWAARTLDLPEFERRVHLCPDPAAQAARIASCIQTSGTRDGAAAVGLADPEIASPLRHALARVGLTVFDPEGQPRRGEPLFRLLTLLLELVREPAFGVVEALARHPDVLAWLAAGQGGFSPARFLAHLDELKGRHLPGSLDRAIEIAAVSGDRWAGLVAPLRAIAGLRDTVAATSFPDGVRAALASLFGDRQFHLDHDDDARAVDTAAAWREAVDDATRAAAFGSLAADEAWELALQALGETVRFDEKPPDALALQGWLELPWEDAPHLLVAGLNDGRVPGAIVGDAFLPEVLRERLGLKTNAARLARDAYLLQSLAAPRRGHGQLDLLLGKTTTAGEPLRPSRLLLTCPDEDLPQRVQFLFREVADEQASIPWQRAWRLAPRTDVPIARMRVTAFRDYLACPFRFFLKHALRMEPVDPHKTELDALDFGTLCHAALEAMGRDEAMRHCTDAGVLRAFLLAALERHARARFGDEPPLPLVVQLESARQRLAHVAEVQAAECAAGWIIEHVEHPIRFEIGGLTISGTIDRIDRHTASGELRVLDYKTSDRAVNPRDAHTRKPAHRDAGNPPPDFARFLPPHSDSECIWRDLQLPLYRRALAATLGAPAAFGYFNLPKAATETNVALWPDYDDAWQATADRCAEGIVAAVRAGRFWPPIELDAENDTFASLFHRGPAGSVSWNSGGTP
jgi:ATP-dependent helicase/nuclease subunit B